LNNTLGGKRDLRGFRNHEYRRDHDLGRLRNGSNHPHPHYLPVSGKQLKKGIFSFASEQAIAYPIRISFWLRAA
jgi:hypothetical protein